MIELPAMPLAQRAGWHALMELHERMPTGWTLIGGQMVHLHCAERGRSPSRPTEVEVGDRQGSVRRPTLLGALVGKAAAIRIAVDPGAARHVVDFAVLTTLIRPGDAVHTAGRRDREHLGNMLGRMVDETSWRFVDGAGGGLRASGSRSSRSRTRLRFHRRHAGASGSAGRRQPQKIPSSSRAM